MTNLTSVHGALKAQYEKRLGELEEKCARLTAANKQLDIRRCAACVPLNPWVTAQQQLPLSWLCVGHGPAASWSGWASSL